MLKATPRRYVWLQDGCTTGASGPWIMARPRLGHRSVNASVINAHVLNIGGYGVRSPIDSL